MNVCSPQIEVVMMNVSRFNDAAMRMRMMRVIFQEESADQIYAQPKCRDPDRLVEMNREWSKKPVDRFARHRKSDDGKHDSARVAAEHADLSCAEAESRVAHM